MSSLRSRHSSETEVNGDKVGGEDVVGVVAEGPACELDGVIVVVVDLDVFIGFGAAGAVIENCLNFV